MEFQSVQYTVDKLIQWIRTGSLALPDFQRDFVWNPSRVVELLDTVAKQWPIGSLLLLSGPQPFGVRPIEGAPPAKDSELDLYVLDGQQRLTSLYHAVSNVSDYCYFVNFNLLEQGDDDYISWERRGKFERDFKDVKARASRKIALISDLWDFDTFYQWLGFIDSEERRAIVKLRETRLVGLQAKVYKVMGIQLDQEIQLEALARIFETLNRTGVKLNAFDLVVAIMYPTGFHLRDEWELVRTHNDFIDAYGVDPLELMKLVSLLIRKAEGKSSAKGIRQGDLLALDKQSIRANWSYAATVYERCLTYAKQYLGVYSSDVVPAWSMVLGLSAWLQLPNQTLVHENVAKWFWGSAFGLKYAQGANTRVVRDFDLIAEGEVGALLGQLVPIDLAIFRQPAKRNGLAMRAFACLVSKLGGVDPLTGIPIGAAEGTSFRVLDNGYLRKVGSADDFTKLIIVSASSDRLMTRSQGSMAALGISPQELAVRFLSQFVVDNVRGPQQFYEMVETATMGVSHE